MFLATIYPISERSAVNFVGKVRIEGRKGKEGRKGWKESEGGGGNSYKDIKKQTHQGSM